MEQLTELPHASDPTGPDVPAPGWPDESWREYAEHSVEGDDLPPRQGRQTAAA